ncbi:hypothetical protein GCM10027359_24660 [Marilutibacter aestuarii]
MWVSTMTASRASFSAAGVASAAAAFEIASQPIASPSGMLKPVRIRVVLQCEGMPGPRRVVPNVAVRAPGCSPAPAPGPVEHHPGRRGHARFIDLRPPGH